MNINTKALKGVIEEVEASKLRQKAEAELQREAIKRAVKEHQLDGKAIRIVLQRRAMGDQKRDEQDYFVHAYEHALAGKKLAAEALERGATIREAAAAGGISTGAAGNLAKVVQKSPKLDTPHDADGVVTETQESCGQSSATVPEEGDEQVSAAAPGPHDAIAEEAVERAFFKSVEIVSTGGPGEGNSASGPADEAPAPRSVGAVVREPATERVAPTEEITSKCKQANDLRTSDGSERITPFMGDDPGEIPAHLRGPSPANRSLRP